MMDCMLRAGRDWGTDVVGEVQSRLFGGVVEAVGRLARFPGVAMIKDPVKLGSCSCSCRYV